jgi:hypothetical protein
MKSITLIGILLIALGVFIFVYKGITYTKKEKIAEIGPLEATKETHKTIALPPILGGLAIASGIGLAIIGNKK